MKILFLILFSLFLIPFAHVTIAEQVEDTVISFVQITQRDDNGTLIAYMEYTDEVSILNVDIFENILNYSGERTIIQINKINFELIQFTDTARTDTLGLLSSVSLLINFDDGNKYKVLELFHNGLQFHPDEKIDVSWTFLRPV
tara:strand:+ start:434 stop:862 length:429 start_codon:yes stop_codon:yes gene_type:complete